jgi:hypothetical protein
VAAAAADAFVTPLSLLLDKEMDVCNRLDMVITFCWSNSKGVTFRKARVVVALIHTFLTKNSSDVQNDPFALSRKCPRLRLRFSI